MIETIMCQTALILKISLSISCALSFLQMYEERERSVMKKYDKKYITASLSLSSCVPEKELTVRRKYVEDEEVSNLSTMEEESVTSAEESERWEAAIDNIPHELRLKYAPFVADLTLATRIKLYKVLDSLDWTYDFCRIVLNVMGHVRKYLEIFVNYSINLSVSRRPLFFYVCKTLEEPQISQLLTQVKYDVVENFMELAFYIDSKELQLMFELMSKLSVQELDAIIHRVDEPMAKHCNLCKSKRLYSLESRLFNGQMNDVHAQMPGTLALYQKADVWKADNDEKFFTFNYEAGVILWRKQIVDLMKICDACLNEVHRASSEVAR